MFLIKYLTCQNHRQLMSWCLSAGLETAFPVGQSQQVALVPGTPEARAVSTAPPSPGLPFTTPHPARVLWATDSLISTEGGHLGGLTWNRGASPIIVGLGDASPPHLVTPGLRGFQNRKEEFIGRRAIFTLDPWTCFRLFWKPRVEVPPLFGKSREVVPLSIIQWSPWEEVLLGNIPFPSKSKGKIYVVSHV